MAGGLNLLVSKALESGLYCVAEIGNEKVKVSYLQYADNTIFIGAVSSQNALAMKRIFRNLELLSSLKINFNKCCLMELNVDMNRIEEMAAILGCDVGEIPFSYLGIRVGASYKKSSEWNTLVQKLKIGEIFGRKKDTFLGSYHPPKCCVVLVAYLTVPLLQTSIQCKFLWGGCENNTKMCLVIWKNICK